MHRFLLQLLLCVVALIVTCTTFKIDSRIVSGRQAQLGQFPWQVILKQDKNDDLLCGGSIISTEWILTAGHCLYKRDSIFLMFGTVDLIDPTAVNMISNELFVHPDYDPTYLNNDIALIKLPKPLVFSATIQAITLVNSASANKNYVGTKATIAGFGLIDDIELEYASILQYATVEIIENSKCVGIFGTNVVLDSTMCAIGYDGSNMSTCSGDSGGPLIIENTSNGQMLQIGINSFVAMDRCTEGYPSGYVRLTSYLDYISIVTGIAIS